MTTAMEKMKASLFIINIKYTLNDFTLRFQKKGCLHPLELFKRGKLVHWVTVYIGIPHVSCVSSNHGSV